MTSKPANNRHHRSDGIPEADSIIARLETLTRKVDDMRAARSHDADSLGDKLLTVLVPAAAAAIAGKIFSSWWSRKGPAKASTTARTESGSTETDDGLITGLVFSALSAAFVAVVSQLSGRGSRAFVNHRHRRAAQRDTSSAR